MVFIPAIWVKAALVTHAGGLEKRTVLRVRQGRDAASTRVQLYDAVADTTEVLPYPDFIEHWVHRGTWASMRTRLSLEARHPWTEQE